MEELKLVLDTIETLGDTGFNLFLLWIGKEMILHIFTGIIIYIIVMAAIKMIKAGMNGWNWSDECKRALKAQYNDHQPLITDFDNNLSESGKKTIIKMINNYTENGDKQ